MAGQTWDVRLLWVASIGSLIGAVGIGAALVLHALGWIKMPGGLEKTLLSVFLVVFALGPPLFALVYFFPVRRRLAGRLIRARLRVCVYCGHDLRGRPEAEPRCSECGREISSRDAARYWRGYLRGGTGSEFAADVEEVWKSGTRASGDR